jgi:integrase/recombinase XerD
MELEALIESYLEFLKYEQQLSYTTAKVRFYELRKFRNYMEQKFDLKDLREIKTHHLRDYISHLSAEEGYRPVSLGNVISGLRALYSFAVGKDIVAANLAQKIKKPKVEQKEVEHFTWEEVERIFLALPRKSSHYLRDVCILLLLYYSGLRIDEMRNLRVSDFSSDLAEVHVEKGKGDKSRLLPVHSFVQRALKLYLKNRQGRHSAYLFPGRGEKPLSKDRIYRIVKKCGQRADITKRVSPHTFKHTFATHLHQKGVDINRLAQLLGHANIEKTAIYTHTDDAELMEAVKKL